MTVESDVAQIYELLWLKGASEETAREVAIALHRQLRPNDDDSTMRDAVARAIATVRLQYAASNDGGPRRGPRKRKLVTIR